MKITLHIPTEQYGFIGVEYETDGAIAYEEAAREYQNFVEAFKPEKVGPGLPKKDFDTFLDNYLMEARTSLSDYEKMDEAQKATIQTIKRSKARIKRLLEKQSEAIDYHND